MPSIAEIDSIVTVTPSEEIQVIFGPGNYEFLNDLSPFAMKVANVIKESDKVIGVSGPVISGHERYKGLTATLLVRLDYADWTRDNHSAAQFKVGRSPARPNGKHPFYHPEGTEISGFPVIMRFGSIDSRLADEQIVNSAMDASHSR